MKKEMKKILFTGLALSLPFIAAAQKGYTIKGQIGKLDKPAKAFLIINDNGKVKVDSVMIVNSKFEFKGSTPSPTDANIRIRHTLDKNSGAAPKKDAKSFLLDNENISFVTSTDSISKAVITGSTLTDESVKVDNYLRPVYDQYQKLDDEFKSQPEAKKQDKDYIKTLEARAKVIADEIVAAKLKYVKENPDQYMSVMALNSTLAPGFDAIAAEKVFLGINENLRNSYLGKKVAERIASTKKTQDGVEAPEFSQTDVDGKIVKLSDYRGKYVLVDFWASWCAPCRRENPNLIKAYDQYHAKGFEILGVSLDKPADREKWLKAIADDKLIWKQVSDLKGWENAAAKLYEVTAIPMNFLIDPDGKIIAKELRGQVLSDKLKSLFGDNSK